MWDKLDAWHSRLMLLENEVQDVVEDHPDQAYILMDQLTRPLQLYQNAAQMAEQRTAFLGKVRQTAGVNYSQGCVRSLILVSVPDPHLSSGVRQCCVQCHLLARRGTVMAQCPLLLHHG